MRRTFLFVFPVVAAGVLAPSQGSGGPHSVYEATDRERNQDQAGVQESAVDSARAEIRKGRSWHASRLLHVAFPDGPGEDRELRLLFARAEAGWRNWVGVLALLGDSVASTAGQETEVWYLRGRALEGQEQWEEAGEAYTRVIESEAGQDSPEGSTRTLEARARKARIASRLGRFDEALLEIEAMGGEDASVAGWVSLNVAEQAAEAGAREATRLALSRVGQPEVRNLGWDLLPRALLAGGDTIGAEAAFWSALPSLESPSDQGEAWSRVGTLRLARGDTVGAKGAFHQVLGLGTAGRQNRVAAETLLELGFDSVTATLAGARTLAGAGRHREALQAYGTYEGLLGENLPADVRLAVARSHLALGQASQALAVIAEVEEEADPDEGGPILVLRIQALRQLGRGGEARAVEDELVQRFPDRPEAVEILYSRAEAFRSRGDRAGAIEGYRATVSLNSAHNLAGQARMLMGQLFLASGEEEEALAVYSEYLASFPDGRRWDEAAYWGARALLAMDRPEEAGELLERLRTGEPLSYYSVRAGELLSEPFEPAIPVSPDSLPYPGYLQARLARFDRLQAFGLEEAAAWETEAMAARVRTDPDTDRRHGVLLRLAHELNARGFTREGINLGWEVQRDGYAMDTHLLKAIYPFPYRDILVAEARDQGVDPFQLAGLIRQESAFWVRARSRADARGLMQVLPSTGRELARVRGPRGFRADEHLYVAEINIHLGVAFFVDMRRRFGEDLPIILSAYNAGPTRATRWRRFPEVEDMPRFVERIPFTETRGYVKNVTRNLAIYSWLYHPETEPDNGPADNGQGSLP